MSLLTPTRSEPRRQGFVRRGFRLSRPGVSLMAQGEPMIWLTGGALTTCLAMIVGLLLLVIWNGLPTFWPARLVQLQLLDGSKVLGELARVERTTLVAGELSALRDGERTAAQALMANRDQLDVVRLMLRTENFELSGEHFRLVFDFMVPAGGETYPEWAVAVERMEWGRFYGEPRQFTVRKRRDSSMLEAELQKLVQFVEANRGQFPSEQSDSIAASATRLQEELRQARQARVDNFVREPAMVDGALRVAVLDDGQSIAFEARIAGQNVTEIREVLNGPENTWRGFETYHRAARDRVNQRRHMERYEIGEINNQLEQARLAVRAQEIELQISAVELAEEMRNQQVSVAGLQAARKPLLDVLQLARTKLADQKPLQNWIEQTAGAQLTQIDEQMREPQSKLDELDLQLKQMPAPAGLAVQRFLTIQREAEQQTAEIQQRILQLTEENSRYELTMATASGQEKPILLADIVRAYPANRLSTMQSVGVYFGRWWEYLTEEPREANSEGGVLPAIWGTVVMTLVMSILVVPFGVFAALYLREYARSGWIVSVIRISISNLAGVPSIVFGVFGLGFFCYLLGAYLDGGPRNAGFTPLVPRIWWFVVIGTALTGLVAFALGLGLLSAKPGSATKWRRWLAYTCLLLWVTAGVSTATLIWLSPYFGGFFVVTLPNPTLGKGGMIWASLTLALLTLPVVIVATEEALASVPNSLREGSFACGASKWQTIRRIVLPHAMPGIMTGMILAMARGAGEVAPLMLVGAVKLQPELPMDGHFPFLHLSRSFMHLGFHIFDLGFQSQNPEAAKPMVFTTTFLLIAIIAVLNLVAFWIRSQLRKRYLGAQF